MSSHPRNSSIELLRLLAMFAIVLHHYCILGGMWSVPGNSVAAYTIAVGGSWGKWGVDVFVLITGYFLSRKNNIRQLADHVIRLYVQVWTTSILCLLIFLTYRGSPLGILGLAKCFFPVGFGIWWFATSYFVLILFSPFLNIMLDNFSKGQHAALVLLMLSIMSISIFIPLLNLGYNNLCVFFMLYSIGAYMRKYWTIKYSNKLFCIAILSLLCMPLVVVALQAVSAYYPWVAKHKLYFVSANSPLTLMASITSLMLVLSRKPFYSQKINRMAAMTFGIYLFTEHYLLRPIIWKDLVQTKVQFASDGIVMAMLVSSVVVFFAAMAVESLRQRLVQKPIMAILGRVLSRKIDALLERIQ